MKLYRIKFNNNTYQSNSFCGSTKDIYKALLPKGLLIHYLEVVDEHRIDSIEVVEIELNKSCKLGSMRFGVGDTYSIDSVDGYIIHETKKFLWTVKIEDYGNGPTVNWSTIEKHKREDINTIDYKTCKGVRITNE